MSEPESMNSYPGIDRLNYFLSKIAMIVIVVLVVFFFGPDSDVLRMLSLPLMIASIVLDVMRLRNIGVSQWFAFARFVPFGSLVLDLFLQSAQTGWIESRSWDRTGRRILMVELSLAALMLLLSFHQLMSPPFWL